MALGPTTRSGDYESLGLLVFFAYMWVQDGTMIFALRRVTVYNVVSVFGMHALAFLVGLGMNQAKGERAGVPRAAAALAALAPLRPLASPRPSLLRVRTLLLQPSSRSSTTARSPTRCGTPRSGSSTSSSPC